MNKLTNNSNIANESSQSFDVYDSSIDSSTLQIRPNTLAFVEANNESSVGKINVVLSSIVDNDENDDSEISSSSSIMSSKTNQDSEDLNKPSPSKQNLNAEAKDDEANLVLAYTGNQNDSSLSMTNSACNSNSNLENIDTKYSSNSISSRNSLNSSSNCSNNLNASFNAVISDIPSLNLEINNDSSLLTVTGVHHQANDYCLPEVKEILSRLVENVANANCESIKFDVNDYKSLYKLFNRLQTKLDDLRANYIELNELYEQTQVFEAFLNKLFETNSNNIKNANSSQLNKQASNEIEDDANLSLALNDVMQYFDFLDAENDNECPNGSEDSAKEKVNLSKTSSSFNNSFSKASMDSNTYLLSSFDLNSSSINFLLANTNSDSNYLFDFDRLLIIHFSNCLRLLNVSWIV